MLTVPNISDYKPFYIQFDGDESATDILTTYSVVVKAHDYPSSYKVKEPYKNQWKDENGDEEYIGNNGLYIEAFTFKLECAMFASGDNNDQAIAYLKGGLRNFQNALKGGLFKVYDSWTGFGFQNVRLDEFPMPDAGAYSVWREKAWSGNVNEPLAFSVKNYTRLIFDVRLKVNDPVTSMGLVDGAIVQNG